jgi:hypothetical protein
MEMTDELQAPTALILGIKSSQHQQTGGRLGPKTCLNMVAVQHIGSHFID